VALGWLGWSEEQALAADVNAIICGHDGKLDMFEVVGWIKREKPAGKGKQPVMTPALFRAKFGRVA
jgi:hypothetical protein